jgi:H+-translocating NAD(P) transhydrogenase subunit alpha
MKVGVGTETAAGERRVALVPDAAGRLQEAGIELLVERGAGAAASFPDRVYEEAGARLVGDAAALYAEADLVAKVQRPSPDEIALLREGQGLIAFLAPLVDPGLVRQVANTGATAFSMDAIPRISRAQTMDALSSHATIAGYKAVLLAASNLPRLFPMMTTAAGTIRPAKVLVLGAGVAGLQAIASSRRLGGVVAAFDTRPVVKEQVESLGATFLELDVQGGETAGGYATELSEEQHEREQELIANHVAQSDAVITTAAIPGRRAPLLVTASAVEAMRPGSVIVDLAAETGGNCELTVPGEIVDHRGVTIVGLRNLPSTMPQDASLMLSRNIEALLRHLVRDGNLELDFDDEITRETCVAHAGKVLREPVAV